MKLRRFFISGSKHGRAKDPTPCTHTSAPSAAHAYLRLNTSFPGLEQIHHSPPIFICEHFLSAGECDELIGAAEPLLQRSKTHSARGSEKSTGRTSLTCHLAKDATLSDTTPPYPTLPPPYPTLPHPTPPQNLLPS